MSIPPFGAPPRFTYWLASPCTITYTTSPWLVMDFHVQKTKLSCLNVFLHLALPSNSSGLPCFHPISAATGCAIDPRLLPLLGACRMGEPWDEPVIASTISPSTFTQLGFTSNLVATLILLCLLISVRGQSVRFTSPSMFRHSPFLPFPFLLNCSFSRQVAVHLRQPPVYLHHFSPF